jgi:hypothetical protein
VQIAYDEVCPDAVLIAEHPAEAALATSFSGIPENSVPAEPLKTMLYINFLVIKHNNKIAWKCITSYAGMKIFLLAHSGAGYARPGRN